MKNIKRLFLVTLGTIVFSLCACQKSPVSEDKSSEAPISSSQKEKKIPHYLTVLPIPNELKQANEKKGIVEKVEYETKIYDINGNGTTSIKKKAEVYVPYDYDESNNYNVLYLMHGGGEDQSYWLSKEKDTVKVLDNIFAQGLAEPCLIVCPTFYTGSSSTGSMNSEATDIFKYEFRNDLVPFIESEYATYCEGDVSPENLINTRSHRGFAGLSMGSMTSIRTALLGCLDIVGYISSMSGGYDASDNDGELGYAKVNEAVTQTFKDYPVLYWLNQNGTGDIALTPHEKLKDLVLDRLSDYFKEDENYKWILFEGGQHNFDAWLVHLYNTLQIFF